LKRLADLKWKTLFGKHQLLVAVQGTSSAQWRDEYGSAF
jgi:hypothetical protein